MLKSNYRLFALNAVALLYLVFNAGTAHATVVTFSDKTAFTAAAGGSQITKDFNRLSATIDRTISETTGDITERESSASSAPIPGAVWLFGSALIGLFLAGRRRFLRDYGVLGRTSL